MSELCSQARISGSGWQDQVEGLWVAGGCEVALASAVNGDRGGFGPVYCIGESRNHEGKDLDGLPSGAWLLVYLNLV